MKQHTLIILIHAEQQSRHRPSIREAIETVCARFEVPPHQKEPIYRLFRVR